MSIVSTWINKLCYTADSEFFTLLLYNRIAFIAKYQLKFELASIGRFCIRESTFYNYTVIYKTLKITRFLLQKLIALSIIIRCYYYSEF